MIRSFWKACAVLWLIDFLVAVSLFLSQTWLFNYVFSGLVDSMLYDAVQNASQFALFIGLFLIPIFVKFAMPQRLPRPSA